jgi:hypothetical protein
VAWLDEEDFDEEKERRKAEEEEKNKLVNQSEYIRKQELQMKYMEQNMENN